MTMHLVKPYLSTTRYNIKKPKLSPKDIKAKKEHEKFLRQMGVGRAINVGSVAEMPTYKSDNRGPQPSDKVGNGFKRSYEEQQDRYEVSSQYSIGPAYNKGGYQVLSKEDQKDPATGKRR